MYFSEIGKNKKAGECPVLAGMGATGTLFAARECERSAFPKGTLQIFNKLSMHIPWNAEIWLWMQVPKVQKETHVMWLSLAQQSQWYAGSGPGFRYGRHC